MRRSLAYGKALAERRRSGERVGLLVVSVHDWSAGLWYEGRPEVCRVVLPDDLAVGDADWSGCLALDVVVCGSANDAVFNAAVRSVLAAGAVSCWGEFGDGVHRLAAVGRLGVVAVDGPFPAAKLGAVLKAYRPAALALGVDGYGSRVFEAARSALFGPLLAELQDSLAEAA